MVDRRYSIRKAVHIPVQFRVLREGIDIVNMHLTAVGRGIIRDLGMHGLSLETSQILLDGLNLQQMTDWEVKARIYLQWLLFEDRQINVIAEAAWCERTPGGAGELYHLGFKFRELPIEARESIKAYLQKGR
jgi:hypothetical protein